MDGAREYYTKQNKSIRQRQIPHAFNHTWNLRNKTGKIMGSGVGGGSEERETNDMRVLMIEKRLG